MGIEDLRKKAKDAFRRKSYDLATQIYLDALDFDANHQETVEGFFQAAKKARETKGKSLFGGLLGKVSAGASRDPKKRMAACFRGLAKNPESRGLLLALGEAAGEAGAPAAAVAAYQRATEADATDATAWKLLGRFQGEQGNIPAALAALDEAVRLSPRDQEAIKLRKNLAAEGALKQGGFETARSSRELIKDKDVAQRLEQEARIQLTPEHAAAEVDRMREQVEQTPKDPRLRVRLGELLQQTGREDEALTAFEEALALDPRNFDLSVRIGDIRLRRLRETAAAAKAAHERAPDDAALAARRQETMQAFLQGQRDEYARRVHDHPLDLAERFKLGQTLLALGEVDTAAAEFQQTVRDPNRKTESLLMLARCFERKGLGSLAVKKLEEALTDFPSISSPRSKDVHYAYADLLERSGDRGRAREVFEAIYEVDITYRDVAQRLDALAKA